MINKYEKSILELAAKSANIPGQYQHWEDGRGYISCGIAPDGAVGRLWWNPLTNAVDRFALARSLGMTIDFEQKTVSVKRGDKIFKDQWDEIQPEGKTITIVAALIQEDVLRTEVNPGFWS